MKVITIDTNVSIEIPEARYYVIDTLSYFTKDRISTNPVTFMALRVPDYKGAFERKHMRFYGRVLLLLEWYLEQ